MGTAVPNHFQCGGGHSGVSLDLIGGKEEREGRTGGEGRCYTTPIVSTRMTAWLHQRIQSGCRECLKTSLGCLPGWDPEKL